ncbi:DUF6153 family protein [Amycolatopsis sp. CA-230715]|uniref:DUF6153 family protein n=1 Tax=Amycolatopsis sp. CA-230715 TaxID=2745196 RepID=UPI001C00DA51|nr:DUF6153 family protein [Amycolatopsis sp. CA-230715]
MGLRRTALRWTLLGLLAFGVLGMHHVVSPEPEPGHVPGAHAMSAMGTAHHDGPSLSAPPAGSHDGHGALHLCLAVFGAAAVLLLALLGWRACRAERSFPRGGVRVAGAGRDPPRGLRSPVFLSLLCVLRV